MAFRNMGGLNQPEEEQGYLVSVSDIMAGLVFLFIITVMVFAFNLHQEKVKQTQQTKYLKAETEQKAREAKKLETETEQKAREAKQLKKIQGELTDGKLARTQLLNDLERSLQKDGVKVRIDLEKGLLQIPESILFESGQDCFRAGGEEKLAKLSMRIAEKVVCYAGKRGRPRPLSCPESRFKPGRLEAVLVEGHTDNRPIHTSRFKDNWELSASRSIVTYRFMLKTSPVLANIFSASSEPLFGVAAYAATRPVAFHEEPTDEPKNRRIDLRFILAQPPIVMTDRIQ